MENSKPEQHPATYSGRYRAIEVNTAVRRLAVFERLVRCVKATSTTGTALDCLFDWSARSERSYVASGLNYSKLPGRVTFQGKRSLSAASSYLKSASALGLLIQSGDVVSGTRVGDVLATVSEPEKPPRPFGLGPAARIFFAYHLLDCDADLLLAVLDMVSDRQPVTLTDLQAALQSSIAYRLEVKATTVSDEEESRRSRQRRNVVLEEWKNPERYAEHIVPPRLAWLIDLGLAEERPLKRTLEYRLSPTGQKLVLLLRGVGPPSLSDITDDWLDRVGLGFLSEIILDLPRPKRWRSLHNEDRRRTIESFVLDAFTRFQYDRVGRISLSQALLYSAIRAAVDGRVIINLAELRHWWADNTVSVSGTAYKAVVGSREGESFLIASDAR